MLLNRSPAAAGAALVVSLCMFSGSSVLVSAEKLSVRQYRIANGLAHNAIRVIRQDSKGYLWVGTGEGISRFDGYRFVNYSTTEGLQVPLINDIVEDPRGRIWVATNGSGVALFLDAAGRQSFFRAFQVAGDTNSNQVNALAVIGETLWCATDGGLYGAAIKSDTALVFELVGRITAITNLFAGSDGRLWGTSAAGVFVSRDGRVDEVGTPLGDRSEILRLVEHERAVLALTGAGLYRLANGPSPAWSRIDLRLAPGERLSALSASATGGIWVASSAGLIHLKGDEVRRIGASDGLPGAGLSSLFEDRDRHLWIGTDLDGLITVSRSRVVSYDVHDGLPESDIVAVTEAPDGAIVATGQSRGGITFRDDKAIKVAGSEIAPFNKIGKRLVCDGLSRCWALTDLGLYEVDASGSVPIDYTRARLVFAARPGAEFVSISGRGPNGLFRDPSGVLWFGTSEPAIYRLDPGPSAPRSTVPAVSRIPIDVPAPMAPLVQDRSGATWIASMSGLGRLRDGKVQFVRPQGGDTLTFDPRAAFVDSRGWLWVGLRYGGVVVSRDPTAGQPVLARYSTANGLSSNTVWNITEDRQGQMYFATNRGLDRLVAATGEIRHFMTTDGLAGDVVSDCLTDRNGRIWLATSGGISRLDPSAATTTPAALPVVISHVEVANDAVPLPETGAAAVSDLQLSPGGNRVVIRYVGLSVGASRELQYQYQLEGVESSWSAPTTTRVVTYAGLGGGRYRFKVRALDGNGSESATPATVEFTVLPPVWQRAWFLVSVVLVATTMGLLIQQQGARRRRATDALRRQVAQDLHDDVGSGLSQIAIMSEVMKRQASDRAAGLSEIARTARSLRDSMSDIVWAVGPSTDRTSDLVDRMRQAAFTLLDFEGLRVQFDAPENDVLDKMRLTSHARRQLLLIFRETVTNVARHARASQLAVRISVTRRTFAMTITDNGAGFDTCTVQRGQGLDSLSARAATFGGTLAVDSAPGQGTTIRVEVAQQ